MSELYILGNGVIVTEDGEIIETPPGMDRLAFLATRLEEARTQRKMYEQEEAILQSAILRIMDGKRAIIDTGASELVVSVKTGTYPVQHTDEFATMLQEMLPDITKEQLINIIHAARSFAPEALPEEFQPLLAQVTEHRPKRSWVDVSRPKRPSSLQKLAQ